MSKKPKPEQCPYNEWVRCSNKTCGTCGWNPAVSIARSLKILANLGKKDRR